MATGFEPAWWLPGGHAQTVAGRYLRRRGGVALQRWRLDTPDGDFLELDFAATQGLAWPAAGETPKLPAAIVLHGLEGCARSGYVLETFRALARRGVLGVGLNFRSCGGEPNRLARSYNAGDTGDLAFAVERLGARHPGLRLGGVGFSLGGNVLLKWLGEEGGAAREVMDAAAAVSVPCDLLASADMLERPMGRVYSRVFLRSLREKVRQKQAALAGLCDVPRGLRVRTLRAFDDAVTGPLHGFSGAAEYYRLSSSNQFLPAIRLPTMLIHSADDPFLPPSAFPRSQVAENPWLTERFTPGGGHVGFISGPPWRPRFWAEQTAARFLAARFAASARETVTPSA
ncbi:MAG: YheT family hydrolase [Longimicrobiaceae bacterium]